MWRGDVNLSHDQQGVRILGVPIGSATLVRRQLEEKSEQETLFHRIPLMDDTQACWLLLLMCAATRVNFWLRAVRPELSESFAERHDTNVWMCLRSILGSERAPDNTRAISQLPLSLGGLGLTSAVRSRVAAHWCSWADCIHMIRQRHPSVAETLITGIHRRPAPCFAAVRTCQGTLEEAGLEIPSWRTLADTPPQREGGADPLSPRWGGSITRHDVWRTNTSGCSCGPLSQTLSAH